MISLHAFGLFSFRSIRGPPDAHPLPAAPQVDVLRAQWESSQVAGPALATPLPSLNPHLDRSIPPVLRPSRFILVSYEAFPTIP